MRDETGTKWRVKLGAEARPEVAASSLLSAVGYLANEDYFVADLQVEGMKPLNSWELKDRNNSVYEEKGISDSPQLYYVISDLGATFGTTGLSYPDHSSKGNLPVYASSMFIKKVSGQYVDSTFRQDQTCSIWSIPNNLSSGYGCGWNVMRLSKPGISMASQDSLRCRTQTI